MIGYIRDPRTWAAVKTVTVTNYELPLETAQGETGKATIVGQLDADYSRYLFSLENSDYVFKITGQQSGDEYATTITISDFVSILENFVDRLLNVEADGGFVGVRYLLRFLSVNVGIPIELTSKYSTKYALATFLGDAYSEIVEKNIPLSDAGLISHYVASGGTSYTLVDTEKAVRGMMAYGIRFNPIVTNMTNYNNVLKMEVSVLDSLSVPILFDDGHSYVLSESYSDNICSAVVIYNENSNRETYYLNSSGQVTTNKSEQINGYASYVKYDSSNYGSMQEQAHAVFAENVHSHKIEFASDKELHIGQPVKLMLSRGVLDTVISKVMLKSGDNRFIYTCGELPVTATDKLKANSWLWGSKLPNNPSKGTLFFDLGG